jgi:hypothetical protein
MQLISHKILEMCALQGQVFDEIIASGLGSRHPTVIGVAQMKGESPEAVYKYLLNDNDDFLVTSFIALKGQTVLFDADLAIELRPTMERFRDQAEVRLPFPAMILQFDQPIPEHVFFNYEPGHWVKSDDSIQALLIAGEEDVITAVAWFASNELNRVKWTMTSADFQRFIKDRDYRASTIALENKRQLQLLAVACVLYMNCENVELERVSAPAQVNAKRERKGKRPLPEYYICRIRKSLYVPTRKEEEEDEDRERRSSPHQHAVRGHFRRLQSGKTTWVVPHFRGVEQGPDKIYRVRREQ